MAPTARPAVTRFLIRTLRQPHRQETQALVEVWFDPQRRERHYLRMPDTGVHRRSSTSRILSAARRAFARAASTV